MGSPAEDTKDMLVSGGIGTFEASSGWSIWIGDPEVKPDTVIGVWDYGGQDPNPALLIDEPFVQIKVRGARGGYAAAYVKAKAIKDLLLGKAAATVNGNRYAGIYMRGDINFIGYDENRRPMLTLNFRMLLNPATGTNRR